MPSWTLCVRICRRLHSHWGPWERGRTGDLLFAGSSFFLAPFRRGSRMVGQNTVHGPGGASDGAAASPRGALDRHDEPRSGQPRPPGTFRRTMPAHQALPLAEVRPQPPCSALVKIIEPAGPDAERNEEGRPHVPGMGQTGGHESAENGNPASSGGTGRKPRIVEHVAHLAAPLHTITAQTDSTSEGPRRARMHRVTQPFQGSLSFSRRFSITEYVDSMESPGDSRMRRGRVCGSQLGARPLK
jgi:hypothetical protein